MKKNSLSPINPSSTPPLLRGRKKGGGLIWKGIRGRGESRRSNQ